MFCFEWFGPVMEKRKKGKATKLMKIKCIQHHSLICTSEMGTFRPWGLMSRVFTNGLGDQGSILGGVIPKTQKNGT